MNDSAAALLTKSREPKRRAAVDEFHRSGCFDQDELRRLEIDAARAERHLQNVIEGLSE